MAVCYDRLSCHHIMYGYNPQWGSRGVISKHWHTTKFGNDEGWPYFISFRCF